MSGFITSKIFNDFPNQSLDQKHLHAELSFDIDWLDYFMALLKFYAIRNRSPLFVALLAR